jgi:hypothetical protein
MIFTFFNHSVQIQLREQNFNIGLCTFKTFNELMRHFEIPVILFFNIQHKNLQLKSLLLNYLYTHAFSTLHMTKQQFQIYN